MHFFPTETITHTHDSAPTIEADILALGERHVTPPLKWGTRQLRALTCTVIDSPIRDITDPYCGKIPFHIDCRNPTLDSYSYCQNVEKDAYRTGNTIPFLVLRHFRHGRETIPCRTQHPKCPWSRDLIITWTVFPVGWESGPKEDLLRKRSLPPSYNHTVQHPYKYPGHAVFPCPLPSGFSIGVY